MQHSATKLAKGTRVITVQQPWATLIALGEKPIENRSWHTSYTGTLAIASSKAFPKHRREDCENPGVKKMLRKHGLSADDLPLGKVLCVTVLLKYRQKSDGGYGFVLDRKRLKVFKPPISYRPEVCILVYGSGSHREAYWSRLPQAVRLR